MIPAEVVMMALTSRMSPRRNYSMEAGAWSSAALKLRNKYEDRYPELFADFSFSLHPYAPPYCKGVSSFLTRADNVLLVPVIGTTKSPNGLYRLDPASQRELKERTTGDIPEEYRNTLPAMAKDMEAAVSI